MRQFIVMTLALVLLGCAGPKAVVPVERQQAQLASQAALQASSTANWLAAQRNWQEAARRHAALDDWSAAGQAVLGEAQALAQLNQPAEATARLSGLVDGARYPAVIRSEAHYQLALLAAERRDEPDALRHLDAIELAGVEPAMRAAVLNLRARLAAERADWPTVRALAAQALASSGLSMAEYANAQRLAGEAAMQTGDWPTAEAALKAALEQDRAQARSLAIALDLGLLAELARRRGDPDAAAQQLRAKSVCDAVRGLSDKVVCGYNRGLPKSGK